MAQNYMKSNNNHFSSPSRLNLFRRRTATPNPDNNNAKSSSSFLQSHKLRLGKRSSNNNNYKSSLNNHGTFETTVSGESSQSSTVDEDCIYVQEYNDNNNNSPSPAKLLGISAPRYTVTSTCYSSNTRNGKHIEETTIEFEESEEDESTKVLEPPGGLFASAWEEAKIEEVTPIKSKSPAATSNTRIMSPPVFSSPRRPDPKRKAKDIVKKAKDKELEESKVFSTTIKIFLLLLEPKSKLFELIHLTYPRKNTTVGDLLKMIPKNATEKVLAKQQYVGITRPKRRAEPITNLKLFASNSVSHSSFTANITPGEIILAIPSQTCSRDVVKVAKQILANAHIQKKLQHANGAGKTKHLKSSSKHRHQHRQQEKGNSNASLSSTIPALESHPVLPTPCNRLHTSIVVTAAENIEEDVDLIRAVDKANAANKEILAQSVTSIKPKHHYEDDENDELDLPQVVLEAYLSKEDMKKVLHEDSSSHTDDDDTSLSSSLHSWSQSIDSSVASMYANMAQEQLQASLYEEQEQRKRKKKKLLKQYNTIKRCTVLATVMTIGRYYWVGAPHYVDTVYEQPLGWVGFFQFVLAIIALIKIQRFWQRPLSQDYDSGCPVMQILRSQRYDDENR